MTNGERPRLPAFGRSAAPLRALALCGAALWIFGTLQYALAQLVVAAAWKTPYSWTGNYISDLGNTACGQFAVHGATTYVCSPLHPLMNGSFICSGALTCVGAVLLRHVWPARRLTRVALVLVLIAGLLKMLVGLAPENGIAALHVLGAANIPVMSVAIVLLSIAIRAPRPGLAWVGLITGATGLVGALLSSAAQSAGTSFELGLGHGGMERIASYPGTLWMFIVGVVVLVAAARSEATVAAGARPHRDVRRDGLAPDPT